MIFRLLLSAVVMSMVSCSRVDRKDARRLVERYNQVVTEAYRKGDVKLIDSVVGPNEGRNLTGLIGVRLDAGLRLDSKLLSLDVKNVTLVNTNDLRVQTSEKWTYRDVKADSGEQVGEASEDAYEMLYLFKKIDGQWMVDKIEFIGTPKVGRKATTWGATARDMHGLPAPGKH